LKLCRRTDNITSAVLQASAAVPARQYKFGFCKFFVLWLFNFAFVSGGLLFKSQAGGQSTLFGNHFNLEKNF
jgi:hypothetical protein